MTEIELLMEETARHYEGKIDKLYLKLREMGNICRKLEKENADLRKDKAKLIRENNNRQHYKNGKRGTKYNG